MQKQFPILNIPGCRRRLLALNVNAICCYWDHTDASGSDGMFWVNLLNHVKAVQ